MKKGSTLLTWLVLILALGIAGCASGAVAAGHPEVVETGIDPESWALIPAGEFFQGQFDHQVTIEYDYEMMVTPVTNEQYARYLNEALAAGTIKIAEGAVLGFYPGEPFHGYKHEEEISAGDYVYIQTDDPSLRLVYDGQTFAVKPGYEDHPMTMVTWFGAQAYCQFYDWRLPGELEWEKAARGTDNRPFPWGEGIENGNANFYASRDPYEEAAGKSGDTTPVGFYNGRSYLGFETIDSPSPYGLYDMAGNVWQWTSDDYPDQHYRYLRGGSKAEYGYNLRVWTRNGATPLYASPNAGFRCARSIP